MRIGRVAIFWVGYLVILFLASYSKPMLPARLGQLAWGLISCLAILGLTLVFLRRERRTVRDVGLDVQATSFVRFLKGLLIGAAVYGLMLLAISLVAGPIRFTRGTTPGNSDIVLMVVTFLALAAMEEMGFRGYPLRTLVAALGHWRAQAVVAVAFSISHLIFGWSWQTVVLGVLPSAVLFGVVAFASGGLAMPIGLHAVINIGRWVTGETDTPGLWLMTIEREGRGPTWMPSVIGIAVTALATVAVWGWYRRGVDR